MPQIFAVDIPCGDQKAGSRNSNHGGAENDERQPGCVTEFLTGQRQRAAGQRRRGKLQEQVKFFHNKSEGHNGNGSAHPGKECSLIRRVVSKILDHLAHLDWR